MKKTKHQSVIQEKKAILIYDAACPVCSNAVRWIEENKIPGTFELLPCQSETLDTRFPLLDRAACMQAVHLVLPNGAVLQGEKTLPEILRRTRRYRILAILFRLPGSQTVSRFLYRWFAKQRYAISNLFHLSLPKNK